MCFIPLLTTYNLFAFGPYFCPLDWLIVGHSTSDHERPQLQGLMTYNLFALGLTSVH